MHDQFLTLRKLKNNSIGEPDTQQDIVIDLRLFFGAHMD